MFQFLDHRKPFLVLHVLFQIISITNEVEARVILSKLSKLKLNPDAPLSTVLASSSVNKLNNTKNLKPHNFVSPLASGFLVSGLDVFTDSRYPKSNRTVKRQRRQSIHMDQAIVEGFVYFLNPFRIGLFADAVMTNINGDSSPLIGSKLNSQFFTDTYRRMLRYTSNIPKILRGSISVADIGNMHQSRRQFQNFVPGIIKRVTSPLVNWTWEEDRFLDYNDHARVVFNRFDFRPRTLFTGWWSQEKFD